MILHTKVYPFLVFGVKQLIHSFHFLFKVGHKQKVELVPNKIHFMKTLSLKPLLFGKRHGLLEINPFV